MENNTILHDCKLPNNAETGYYGPAVTTCFEDNGIFYVSNDEYDNQVNYCPFCGAKAPKQITLHKYDIPRSS